MNLAKKMFGNKPIYINNITKVLSNITRDFEGLLFVSLIFFFVLNIMQVNTIKGYTKKYHQQKSRVFCQGCNVILISLDALRAQELPCYGYALNTAPNLCKFARDNVLFNYTYSQSNFTLDSHMSIITSLYPTSHNMRVITKDVLHPDIKTLPQVLSENGYETYYVGITTDPTLPLNKGFERGFKNIIQSTGDIEDLKSTLIRIKENNLKNIPTFAFFHTYDIHGPYTLPDNYINPVFAKNSVSNIPVTQEEVNKIDREFVDYAIMDLRKRINLSDTKESLERNKMLYKGLSEAKTLKDAEDFINANRADDINFLFYWKYYSKVNVDNPKDTQYLQSLYDEKIYITDKKLKEAFDMIYDLDMQNNTIVIITSDHGEEFYEHGAFDHVYNIYETETHIPLIMMVPKVKNFVSTDPTQSIDILPTVLGLLNIAVPEQAQGLNLASYLYGADFPIPNRSVISEHHNQKLKSIKFGSWRLYTEGDDYKSVELFKVSEDTDEQVNVIKKHPSIAENLRSKMVDILDQLKTYPQSGEEFPKWIDEKQRRKLIEEGYF